MTKNAQRRSDRYTAASIAQYLHELSGRHAQERADAVKRAVDQARAIKPAVALAGR